MRREGVTVEVGDIVLVLLEPGIRRPLIVSKAGMVDMFDSRQSMQVVAQVYRVSGVLICEPDDHTSRVFREYWAPAGDPARITGRPDRLLPFAYGESLGHGSGIGQWISKPTKGV